jgi:hypothetical protein
MKNSVALWLAPLFALTPHQAASAQEISGFSTESIINKPSCTPHATPLTTASAPAGISAPVPPPIPYCPPGGKPVYTETVEPYADTNEDYTASLYYNVTSTSVLYYEGSNTYLTGGTGTGNPTAAGTYSYQNPVAGVYTEVTGHYVDFFYIASAGEYYDPYGYSLTNGEGGDTDGSGYWFSVFVYGTYLAEAQVLLGESFDSQNYSTNYQGPTAQTITYQAFIPPNNVPGPPPAANLSCVSAVYAGDNRTTASGTAAFNPQIGSYRGLQQVSVGVGGLTSITSTTAPPIDIAGYSFAFNSKVLVNGLIPDTAYNYDYLGQCNAATIDEWAPDSTANFIPPFVTYSNGGSNVTLTGREKNPISSVALSIVWNHNIVLTEPTPSDLHVSGNFTATCYPAHELTVGYTDVATWNPSSNSLPYITACLTNAVPVSINLNTDIPLYAAP